jgi:hypothetical protein
MGINDLIKDSELFKSIVGRTPGSGVNINEIDITDANIDQIYLDLAKMQRSLKQDARFTPEYRELFEMVDRAYRVNCDGYKFKEAVFDIFKKVDKFYQKA